MSEKFKLEVYNDPHGRYGEWYRITDEKNTPVPFKPMLANYADKKEYLQRYVDWLNEISSIQIPELIPDRYVTMNEDEVFYVTDTTQVRSLAKFKEIFSDPEYEYTPEEIEEVAKQEYWQELYEMSMDGKEIANQLNYYHMENYHLKKRIAELEDNLEYKHKYSMPCKVINDYIDYRQVVLDIIDEELDHVYAEKQQKGNVRVLAPSIDDRIKLLKCIKWRL